LEVFASMVYFLLSTITMRLAETSEQTDGEQQADYDAQQKDF